MVHGPVSSHLSRERGRIAAVGVALLVVMAAAGAVAVASPSGLSYEKVALTGDQAPGTAPGVVFSAFTGPYTHPEPGPRIDAQGRVSFFALISGPGVVTANHSGVWSQHSGVLGLEARAGEQVAGAAVGTTFRAFTEDFAPSTPLIGNGRIGFTASLTGAGVSGANSSGIWTRGGGGGLELFARTGSQAPGTASGVVFTEPLYLRDASDAGHLLLTAHLSGPGVSDANGDGFWSNRSGSPSLILREGQQAPGLPAGVVFGAGQFLGSTDPFPIVRWNEASELALQGNLLGPGVTTFSNEAVFAERGGQLRLIMREGDPAPGAGGGATFGGNSVLLQMYALSFNRLGQVAFDVMLGGTQHGTTLLYSDHKGTLLPVAMPFDPAPGTNGGQFGLMVAPTLSDGGHIAFRAALADAGTWPPFGIWWDQPGPLTALVTPGQPVPGQPPGTTLVGVDYMDGFNAAGQLAFRAAVEDPSGAFAMALFLAAPSGQLRLVARADAPFDVVGDGSDMRTVREITTGGLSENGTVAFRLDFMDNTSGIFTASVAGPPGAAGELMLEKNANGRLDMTWSEDCGGGTRYAIYRGDLRAGISSMMPVTGYCAVGGTTASVPAGAGSAEFYLVVPNAGGFEGSYGWDSTGTARPPALAPCHPRDEVDSCQP